MADGEKYDIVDSVCYLGDMLKHGGWSGCSSNSMSEVAWKRFRELAAFLTSKAPYIEDEEPGLHGMHSKLLLYGSDTWSRDMRVKLES